MTLTSRLPDCPVGTTCRQRQNLDPARVCGFESELELRLAREWRLLASYLFADSLVVDASQQPGLEGKRLAQVPEHGATAGGRFTHPDWVQRDADCPPRRRPVRGRPQHAAARELRRRKSTEIYIAVENLLDRIYTTGRTSEGVISTGEPRMARAGLRLRF